MSSGALDVGAMLAASQANARSRPSVLVDKEDLQYDLGHLYAYDPSPIDEAALGAEGLSAYLLRCSRENAQLLTNQLYLKLQGGTGKQTIVLPKPAMQLPREKPLPAEKAMTRWEKFAQQKGIVKKKRSKMVWDEQTQQWAPRYGYGRANNHKDAPENWVVEAKPGDDGKTDPFETRATERKQRLDKQKRQEERNRLEAAHAATMGSGGGGGGGRGSAGSALSTSSDKKAYLKRAITAVQSSTASMGRFDKMQANEPDRDRGKRKQYESGVGAADAERDAQRTASVVSKMFPDGGRAHKDVIKRDVAAKRSKLDHEAQQQRKGGGEPKGKSKGGAKGKKWRAS